MLLAKLLYDEAGPTEKVHIGRKKDDFDKELDNYMDFVKMQFEMEGIAQVVLNRIESDIFKPDTIKGTIEQKNQFSGVTDPNSKFNKTDFDTLKNDPIWNLAQTVADKTVRGGPFLIDFSDNVLQFATGGAMPSYNPDYYIQEKAALIGRVQFYSLEKKDP